MILRTPRLFLRRYWIEVLVGLLRTAAAVATVTVWGE